MCGGGDTTRCGVGSSGTEGAVEVEETGADRSNDDGAGRNVVVGRSFDGVECGGRIGERTGAMGTGRAPGLREVAAFDPVAVPVCGEHWYGQFDEIEQEACPIDGVWLGYGVDEFGESEVGAVSYFCRKERRGFRSAQVMERALHQE